MNINEVFSSIQGEGIHTGCPAIFVRFSGCNMKCSFCDTNHKLLSDRILDDLILEIKALSRNGEIGLVVITGGEPLLQKDDLTDLCFALTALGYEIELETNGTIELSCTLKTIINYISFSPKTPLSDIKIKGCTSLKILYPYLPGVTAEKYENFPAHQRFIQPLEEKDNFHIEESIAEVKRLGSQWKLGVQLHKLIYVR
jgi:7-carboxy-7-deazaguanine synthase